MMTIPIDEARARLERQLAAPKNIRFDNDGWHELVPDVDADDIRAVLASLDAATTERDAAVYELTRFKEAIAKRPSYEMLWEEVSERAEAAEAERDALRKELAEAVRLLEPFAAHCRAFEAYAARHNKAGRAVSTGDNMTLLYGIEPDLNLGHLRRAAAFVSRQKEAGR